MNAPAKLHSRAKDFRYDPTVVYARLFGRLTQHYLQERRDAGLPVSSVHSEAHLKGVADLVPAIGEAYGFSEREVLLGRFVGQFHDIVRDPREDLNDKNERDSALKSVGVLEDLNNKRLFLTIPEEREAVSYAILNHGRPPQFFRDPDLREETPIELKDKLHIMVYVADGLQKLGAPLIHRRSAFVGGERRATGDLGEVNIDGRPIDAVEAILLESAIRLGWKNVEGLYPKKLRDFIKPAFAIQRDWVNGLLAERGMTMERWAALLLGAINQKGKNIFQFTTPELDFQPESIDQVIAVLNDRGKITDLTIEAAAFDPDLMNSSLEAALYFSEIWQMDSSEAIRSWQPEGRRAKIWKKGM